VNGHPQFEEEFDLYALGALDGEELRGLDSHLKLCPDCRRKLEEARGRIALLALVAPRQPAPDHIKERLMGQIAGRPVAPPVPHLAAIWRWAVPTLSAVLVVLVVLAVNLKNQNNELSRRLSNVEAEHQGMEVELSRARAIAELLTSPDTARITLVSGEASPVPQAKAFYHPQKGLIFIAANLPVLPPGKTYQLWLVPTEGSPISAGVFPTDVHGNGEVVLPPLRSGIIAKAFAVTIEPAGGVSQPTGPKVLIGLAT
jgi:anti-sigma-K factor RskA